MDCMIIGDSIAVGTAVYRPDCVSYSRGGWNSWQWNRDYLNIASQKAYKTVIISLGSNDHSGVKTRFELEKVRSNIKGASVFWILPAIKPEIQQIVRDIAEENKDTIIPITSLQPDKIHPTGEGYKTIGRFAK